MASSVAKQHHQATGLALTITVSTLDEHFQCPICLGEIQSCHLIKECAHAFCETCIRECLNRKHHCPLCQVASSSASLVKNAPFDQLIASVRESARKQAIKITRKLLPHHSPTAPEAHLPPHMPLLARDESSAAASAVLSPIETLFRQQIVSRALLPFEEVLQELRLSKEREEQERSDQMEDVCCSPVSASSSDAAPAAAAVAASSSPPAAAPAASFQDRAMLTVEHAYSQYLQDLPVSSFLEPLVFSIVLQPNNPPALAIDPNSSSSAAAPIRFRVVSRAWEDLERLVQKLIAESAQPEYARGLALKAVPLLAPGVTMTLVGTSKPRPSFPPLPLLLNSSNAADAQRSFHSLGLSGAGDIDLLIKGAIEFVESAPRECFMQTYRPNADQRVDYFKCQDCALNWVCSTCSLSCHAGHVLLPFMLSHKPTYGACYCDKKRLCKLKHR